MKRMYPISISILCFDGEGEGGTGNAANGEGVGTGNTGAGEGTGGSEEKQFSQADLNKILAEDKRKHQEKYKQLEGSYQNILEDKNLASEQRERMEKDLADLQKSFRTKEQQAEFERKQTAEKYQVDLDAATVRADHWENLYKDEKILRSLQDAAMDADAFNTSQIVGLLRPGTELKEMDGALTPMIDFVDIDEKTGEEIRTLRTPADAVKRMKDLPKMYGNLFKSNVVSGVGAGSGGGTAGSGVGEQVDVASLTPEQYRDIRAKNPERLGLPRNRRKT